MSVKHMHKLYNTCKHGKTHVKRLGIYYSLLIGVQLRSITNNNLHRELAHTNSLARVNYKRSLVIYKGLLKSRPHAYHFIFSRYVAA